MGSRCGLAREKWAFCNTATEQLIVVRVKRNENWQRLSIVDLQVSRGHSTTLQLNNGLLFS
jgi:hypothetical protein